MLTNLLLLRGNIGKPGAGICPVRGHSNVQGQRTVGITEKPELAPLDRLAEQYGFSPPRDLGMNTVEVCEAMQRSKVSAFIGLGGNFIRAVPDREPNRGGMAEDAADRADLDKAESQTCHSRRGGIHPAMPWTHGSGSTGERDPRRCRWRTAPAASMVRKDAARRRANI